MPIVETLAPLVLLIVLGAVLARIRFLGGQFMVDLNKLAFWIALPALLFVSGVHASTPGHQTLLLLGVVYAGTFLISLLAWGVSCALKIPPSVHGTLIQSSFRGNLAYIGIPVLAYSFGSMPAADSKQIMATAVIVTVMTMAIYNILAVLVLQASRHSTEPVHWSHVLKNILTNPLLIAGLLGLSVPLLNLQLPTFLMRAIDMLGAAAVPIALLCIGGALATTSLKGRHSWITAAALLKVAILPAIVFGLSRLVGLGPGEQRIALVLTACPTAAASFVMAREMGGDTALASGSIVLSTILSGISLAVALWLTA